MRRKRSEPLQRRCGSFPAALELGCAQMALQALAAPGLVRAGFRMVLLSGEVETRQRPARQRQRQRQRRTQFRIALLSGEVETATGSGPTTLTTRFRIALLSGEVETTIYLKMVLRSLLVSGANGSLGSLFQYFGSPHQKPLERLPWKPISAVAPYPATSPPLGCSRSPQPSFPAAVRQVLGVRAVFSWSFAFPRQS